MMPAPATSGRISIAFADQRGEGWTGGAQYQANLVGALGRIEESRRPEIVLLTSTAAPGSSSNIIQGFDRTIAVPRPFVPQESRASRLVRRVLRRITPQQEQPHFLARFLREQGVDVLYSGVHYGPAFNFPLLGWIPDFQHLHLPEFFSEQELRARHESYDGIAEHATRIIVSSVDAKNDLKRFKEGCVERARVLSFVAQLPAGQFEADPRWICREYHLPERFFFLPNQFWKHKNHAVVIEALEQVKRSHPDVLVVCTGNTSDYRAPHYFGELLADIARRGLRNHFIILGLVPREHLVPLIRQSLAVIQPSKFEGWSTTVEEVKSIGKRIVISDLPVHREQNPPLAEFFDKDAPGALAEILIQALENYSAGPDCDLEAQARAEFPVRLQRFGEAFLEIAVDAAGSTAVMGAAG